MAVTIRVTAKSARVEAQPVHPVAVTPADGARVVVLPTPGPPGPPGDTELSPEERDQVIADVVADLEPPVNLILLFQNGMA
ncbi:hypothetical protein IU451_29345 [Nocardia cyriacigeorgica]|uniref:hypothetical protein n=1 Tax=Nocardia cyriacigeorgica TaxID=135487 RepID=UPI001893B8C7|nr:hypothetical protein [Nocardia cyriacigeorgica]MBF6326607.1 hypothetical protein [Nocardia cyriacigeorgica]